MGRMGLTSVPKMPDFAEALDAHRADLGDLAGARPRAGGLEVEGDERHVGQVGVGALPSGESEKLVASGVRDRNGGRG